MIDGFGIMLLCSITELAATKAVVWDLRTRRDEFPDLWQELTELHSRAVEHMSQDIKATQHANTIRDEFLDLIHRASETIYE